MFDHAASLNTDVYQGKNIDEINKRLDFQLKRYTVELFTISLRSSQITNYVAGQVPSLFLELSMRAPYHT
jgi:hypothetical protein